MESTVAVELERSELKSTVVVELQRLEFELSVAVELQRLEFELSVAVEFAAFQAVATCPTCSALNARFWRSIAA